MIDNLKKPDLPSWDPTTLKQRLSAIRPRLLAFTRLHFHDHDYAEDIVQEALTLAWLKIDTFRQESLFETWVFGILRYKLLDAIRAKSRFERFHYNPHELDNLDDQFKDNGRWDPDQTPSAWNSPLESVEQDGFWEVFDICVYQLPEQTARVFTMREQLGFETTEICMLLTLSPDNCWVILHRARLKLRKCLEISWFTTEETVS